MIFEHGRPDTDIYAFPVYLLATCARVYSIRMCPQEVETV